MKSFRFRKNLVYIQRKKEYRAGPLSCRSFGPLSVLFCIVSSSEQQEEINKKIKAKNTNSASENAITSVLLTYHETSFME